MESMCQARETCMLLLSKRNVLSNISHVHLMQIIHELCITSARYLKTLSQRIVSDPLCDSGWKSYSRISRHMALSAFEVLKALRRTALCIYCLYISSVNFCL